MNLKEILMLFIVGFFFIGKTDIDGLSLFFKLWKGLYGIIIYLIQKM